MESVKTKAMVLAICVVVLMAMSGAIMISAATPDQQFDSTTGDTIKDVKTIQLDQKISASSGCAVLWDLTHGVYLSYEPSGWFSSLVSLLSSKGYTVDTTNAGILNIDLSQYDILVICLGSAWDSAYTPEEVSAIDSFVQNGGGLLVMGDNTGCPNGNINPVAQAFGTTCGVSDLSPLDLDVTDLAPHSIFEGVSEFYMRAAGEVDGVSPSGEVAWADGLATVTVATFGSGRVVITGDANFCDDRSISNADNQLMSENIFDWLCVTNPWQDINKELNALIEKVNAATMPNIIKNRLIDKLVYAKALKDNAHEECEADNFDAATKKLGVAKNQVESFASMVRITRRISAADKASFLADSTEIIGKIQALIEHIETEHKC